MNNNDILRRLRFAFDFSNKDAVALFSLDPGSSATMDQKDFLTRLAKEDSEEFLPCTDGELCAFLDGLIVAKRGLRDGIVASPAKPDDFRMSKNDILKKLRIAMTFQEQQMLDTLELGGTSISKSELGAIFRNPKHKHFRACGNQVLRNFIKGLTILLRGDIATET